MVAHDSALCDTALTGALAIILHQLQLGRHALCSMADLICSLEGEVWLPQQVFSCFVVPDPEHQTIPKNLIRGDGFEHTPFSQLTECSAVLVIALPGFLTASVEAKALKGDVLSWFIVPLKLLQNGLHFLSVTLACPLERGEDITWLLSNNG